MDTKVCKYCNEEKLLTEFYKHKRSPQGRASKCKKCESEYQLDRYHDPNIFTPQGGIEAKKRWKQANKDKTNAYARKKYHTDIEYKLRVNLRNRIYQYLTKGDNEKSIDFLGCSINEWKTFLENQFTAEMKWENYGSYWEIDHIIPLAKKGTFHYTNTQPLTIEENRKKGANLAFS